jgi:hypothetical protein
MVQELQEWVTPARIKMWMRRLSSSCGNGLQQKPRTKTLSMRRQMTLAKGHLILSLPGCTE